MDAYNLQQELFKAWQKIAVMPNATSIKKEWQDTPVYVDGRRVVAVKVEQDKIILETK